MNPVRDARTLVYPTRRAVVLMAAGAPLSLVLALVAPALWVSGVIWIAGAGLLLLVDVLAGANGRFATLAVASPGTLSINGAGVARIDVGFAGAGPKAVEIVLDMGPLLAVSPPQSRSPVAGGGASASFALSPARRGEAVLAGLWARWTGPLGLAWKQVTERPDLAVLITPDVQGVKDEAARLFARQAMHGVRMQLETGEGAEFHTLKDFQPGMDTRAIDWKQSARHGQLLSREYRVERNNPVVAVIDTGRSMAEPIGRMARLDWALNAALLMAYVSLKVGDRAGLYSFDARPARLIGPVGGVRAFSALQQAAGRIDYSTDETNFTYGLSTLAYRLDRRSLVVVFTEFTDPTAAELMVESVGKLLGRHLVLFVVMRDEDLEGLVEAEPATPEDVTRAVIAGSLLRERDLVIARLRRMGVEIVDTPAPAMGRALIDRYLDLKRRNRI